MTKLVHLTAVSNSAFNEWTLYTELGSTWTVRVVILSENFPSGTD